MTKKLMIRDFCVSEIRPVDIYCDLTIEVAVGSGSIELVSVWTDKVLVVSECCDCERAATVDDLAFIREHVESLGSEWLWERVEAAHGRIPEPSLV